VGFGAPPNWLLLYAGTLLALLSHLLLDWTNNYGIRPFFPFNPRWYAGSFVFIFEPVLFAILVLALVLPPLFGLINAEVGARKRRFASRGWSFTALLLIAALYVLRYDQRQIAMRLASEAQQQPVASVFASPHPTDPFTWSVVTDAPDAYRLSTISTRAGADVPAPYDTLFKPPTTLPLLVAKRSYLGRIYLDWSMYPILTNTPDTSDPNHPLSRVTFADARFLYDSMLLNGSAQAPLSGWVLLDMQEPEGSRVVETKFDGRTQK
jgi:inner membrane protein